MTAASSARLFCQNDNTAAPVPSPVELDVAASTVIYKGTIVCVDASGNATPAVTASSAASTLRVAGIAYSSVDNSTGTAGALKVRVFSGIVPLENGDTITKSSIGDPCYAGDNQTAYKSSASGTRPLLGVIKGVDPVSGKVYVQVIPGFARAFNSSNLLLCETYTQPADAAASTTTAENIMIRLPMTGTISSIKLTPTGAATASDTLYATITLNKRDGAGGSSTTMATVTTKTSGSGGTGNWVAFTTIDVGTLTGAYCAAGTVFTITVAKASTGTQLPQFAVSFNYTASP